jgi:GNAT superfamily N-acetyltransferase
VSDISVNLATILDIAFIDDLQRKNAEELSFYPSCVFEREVENGRIILARVNGEPAGYIYHGAFSPVCKIHQACIHYDLRGQLYGSALVRFFRSLCEAAGVMSITLRCGSDIAANGFWAAMGFDCQSVTPGGVRRMRDINEWRLDMSPQLFTTSVLPSDKAQDASLWRKHKDGTKSQFMRGKDMADYRALILSKADKSNA